jgi:lysyl-tRNA synthetase class II
MKIPTTSLVLALLAGAASAQAVNDFPTDARAEYVFTCMATNGQNREMLDRCSCAIDQIASVLPYDDYVEAETVLRMRQVTGERATMFRGMAQMTEIVANLRRAEAEAEILCF